MNRAYSILTVKAVQEDQRIIRGTATTPEVDRVGDIVDPLGVTFKNPLPLLHQHDSEKPVGTVKFDKPTKDGITFEAKLPVIAEPGTLKDRVDTAWGEIKAGLIRAVSIGFKALEYSFMDDGGIRYITSEVLELSLVSVPANASAVISQIKSIDAPLLAATGKEPKASDRPAPPGVTGKSQPVKLTPKEGKNVKTIAEQIAEWEAKRAAKAARQTEIMTKAAESGQTLDAAEGEEHDTIGEEISQIDKHLERLEAQKVQMAAKAVAVTASNSEEGSRARAPGYVQVLEPKLEKGIGFARFAMALATAKGNVMLAEQVAKSRWPTYSPLHEIMKAAVAAGTTSDASFAGPLVQYQILANEFIEFLRPQTIIGKFGVNGIPSLRRVPFKVKVPRQTTKGSGYWVGEGKPTPLTSFALDTVTLDFTKVGSIAVLDKELIRLSNPSAEMLCRDELAAAVIERVDIDFVDPNNSGSSTVKPASITNGATNVVSSGDLFANVITDVQSLLAVFIQANINTGNCVWIMNENVATALSLLYTSLGVRQFPDITSGGGTFLGRPVIVSQYVPTAIVILASANDIYLADDGNVTIDASEEASLEMLNASLVQDATAGTGTSLVSMFQSNSVAIRAVREINWVKRRSLAVGYISSANWGGTVGSGDI